MIVVRPKNGTGEDQLANLVSALKARNRKLADYKRLAGYILWDREFSRTASQKIKREPLARELRAAVDRGSIRAL